MDYFQNVDFGKLGPALEPPKPPPAKKSGFFDTLGDYGISALKGAIGVPEAAVGLADIVTGGAAGKMAEAVGFRPKEAKDILSKAYTTEQQAKFQEVQSADGFIDTAAAALRNPSTIAHAVVESAPSMLAGGVVGRGALAMAPKMSPVLAGALGEGTVAAGSAAEQIRQETADGLLTGKQAALAGATGFTTGGLSLVGGKVAKSLGIGDVDTLLAGAARNPGVQKGIVRRVLEGAAAEGVLEELPQSVVEQVLQNEALGKPLDEGVDHAAVMGMLSGGVMGAGANLRSGGITKAMQDVQAKYDAERQQVEQLRQAGDGPGADALEKTIARKVAADGAAVELDALAGDAPEGSFLTQPAFQRQYQGLREAGKTPAEAAAIGALVHRFWETGTQGGMSEKAITKAVEAFRGLPQEKMAQAFESFAATMRQTGGSKADIAASDLQDAMTQGIQAVATSIYGRAASEAETDRILARMEAQAQRDLEGLRDFGDRTPDVVEPMAAAPAASVAPDAAPLPEPAAPVRPEPSAVMAAPPAPAAAAVSPVMDTPEAEAVHQAATSPTNDLPEPSDAQKAAGNYKVGRMRVAGLDISIENPQGSVRRGTSADGTAWETPMQDHYGYFRGTTAADGDKLDVFVKPGTTEDWDGPVFVVDQIDPRTGKLDEHKVVLGAADEAEAETVYRRNYSADWQGLGAITRLPIAAFKAWARSGKLKEPLGDISQAATQPVAITAPAQADASPAPGGEAVPDAAAPVRAGGADDVQPDPAPVADVETPAAEAAAPAAPPAPFTWTLNPQGTLAVRGDPAQIRARMKAAGVTKMMPMKGGIVVGKTQAELARTALEAGAGQAAPAAEAAAAPPAQPPKVAVAPAPAKKPRPESKPARDARGAEEARAAYFTPGNIVRGYAGFDEVLEYRAPTQEGGAWSVKVHEVKEVDGEWVRVGKPQDAREHSTQPSEERLREGPHAKVSPAAGPDVPYTAPRADGQPFANAPGRGSVAPVSKSPSKPRMGESADAVWQAIMEAAGGIVERENGSRLTYPTLRVVGGDDFRLGANNKLEVVDKKSGGAGVRDATDAEADEFHRDLNEDRVQVLLLSSPGFGSGYKTQRVLRELHSPSGLGFKQQRSDQAKAAPAAPAIDAMAPEAEMTLAAAEDVAARQPDTITDLGEKIGGARKDTADRGYTRGKKTEEDGRPAWARRFKVSQIVETGQIDKPNVGRWVIHDSRSLDRMGNPKQVGGWKQTFATKEEAEAYIPMAAVALKHRVVLNGSKHEIWRDITDRKRVKVVEQQFDSRDEAMAYMAQHAAEIVETNTTFGEADLPLPPDRARAGVQRRSGNVSGKDFMDTFGFRAVEFGNWNNQDERQALMNDAYDGMLDLAEVLGIPPKALALNGDLALAFGARGQGLSSARAHYEAKRTVINLTKERGAGSLAHEWFHALDHYFARQDGKAPQQWKKNADGTRELAAGDPEQYLASHGFRLRDSGVREEVRTAYANLIATLFKKATVYVEDTAKADAFTARAKEDLAQQLDRLRGELSAQKDPAYWKRNNKPASAEQLAQFDAIAKTMLDGDVQSLATDWRTVKTATGRATSRWTNDTLEQLGELYKAVRGRSGFSAERSGTLDSLRGYMERYSQRLKMLADAQQATEKTRMVPTEFAMNAKELDQGRGGDYWTTPHEMAARAFQGYVEDKIAETGSMSRFLNYAPERAGIITPWGVKRPYPAGEERKAINAAIDGFVKSLKTRETDTGVAMYAMDARMPSGLTMQEARDRIREMRGADIGQVRAIVDSIRKAWNGGPAVEVVSSYRDLPGGGTPGARGMYMGGKVWVVATGHRAGPDLHRRVASTLAHEVIAHYGLRKILGADFDRLLTKPLQLAIASGNKPMIALRDRVKSLYRDKNGNYSLSKREESDEIAALAVENAIDAEGNFRPGYSWLKSVWARVAQFLRDMGIDVQFTNAELQGMLVQALRAVESGDRFNGGGRLVVGGDAAAREARAFHGTPHRGIEKFSTDKIGTGEGAQAFGWGLYFASRREIAEHYRNKLSKRTAGHNTIDGKRITDKVLEQLRNDADPYVSGFFRSRDGARAKGVTSIVKAVQDAIESATEFRDEYQGRLDSYLANPPVASTYKPDDYRGFIAQFDKKIAGLQALQKRVQYVAPRINGQLYEVEIPEDSEMLLWDKPMSEQPALSVSKVFNQGWQHALYRVNGSKDIRDFTGAELYRALSVQMGGDRAASDALASLGIKGIKYLDGGSRADGDGSYNYVIFSGDDVAIQAALYARGEDQTNTPAFQGATRDSGAFDPSSADSRFSSRAVLPGKPPVLEGAPDGNATDAEALTDLLESPAFRLKGLGGLDVPSQREVLHRVLALGDDLKILRSVVQLIPVDVVNILAGKNLTPESLFRDQAVLKEFLSADLKGSVATAVDVANSLVRAVASVAAKDPSALARVFGRGGEVRGATGANVVDRAHASIVNQDSIGNRGTFDPQNPDIRYALGEQPRDDAGRFAAAPQEDDPNGPQINRTLRAMVATDLPHRAGNKLTDYRGLGLQFLGRRQLVDIYRDMLPQLPAYSDLVQRMDADKNEAGAGADDLAHRWGKLPDERALAELMHDATLAQIDPSQDFNPTDDEVTYLELRARYGDLSDGAKEIYREARDTYTRHRENVRDAIKQRIERSELKGERKAALLKQMDDEFFKAVRGVYFPLARFGEYVIVTKNADGKTENVSRAETMSEAEATQRALRAAYPAADGFTVGKILKSKEFNAQRDAVGRGFMTELYEVLGDKVGDEKQRAELEDALGQLYLSSLPDLSWAKHGIHRKGTPGFSQDARRAFAQNVFHGARYLAKLRFSDLLQAELTAMQKHVEAQAGNPAYDSVKGQQVVDEMVKRHEKLMNPDTNALSTALTSAGFVFHLGLSPASAMVNLSQTALVAYPVMGAKWGWGKASAALMEASQQAIRGKNDISGALTQDERRAYDEAVRSGLIDVTMAHDLAGIAQGEDAKVSWKIRPVMRWAGFLFHHAERFNRSVTFVASYRLARDAGANHGQAYRDAVQATYDGHFDYSAGNRPRVMQGNVARVVLLFKQYSQNSAYLLTRQAYLAVKGLTPDERSQARQTLAGVLTMHAMAAGVLGLPAVTTLLAAASMIGGSDDEPWDAKVALQNYLADAFGKKTAEVMMRGFSRLTPWDISGRVALDKLLLPDVREGLEGQSQWEAWASAALGPVGGIAGGIVKGMGEIADGQYKRGLEAMLPAVVRGPIKAWRYGDEGALDKTGVPILEDVSPAAVFGQAMGFSPSEVRSASEGKSAIMDLDRRLNVRRRLLLSHYTSAVMAEDQEGIDDAREAIDAFNKAQPQRMISARTMAQSVKNRRRRVTEAEQGVYLPKSRRDALEAGRFAMAEDD